MLVLKIILFIAALLFFFIGIAFFSSSDEEIGTPFIILGAAALVVAILLCFKLYLASKITLAAAAGLLLLLGIGNMGDSEETEGWFCIIAAAILALLSFAWFMNWIGGTKRTDEDAAVTKAQESRSSVQYVGVTGAAENEDAPKRRNAQWLFMKEE